LKDSLINHGTVVVMRLNFMSSVEIYCIFLATGGVSNCRRQELSESLCLDLRLAISSASNRSVRRRSGFWCLV